MKTDKQFYQEALNKLITSLPGKIDLHDAFFEITKMKEDADQYVIDCFDESAWGKMLEKHQLAFMHITRIFDAIRDVQSWKPEVNPSGNIRLEEVEDMSADTHLIKSGQLYLKIDLESAFNMQKAIRNLVFYYNPDNMQAGDDLGSAMQLLELLSFDYEEVRSLAGE